MGEQDIGHWLTRTCSSLHTHRRC